MALVVFGITTILCGKRSASLISLVDLPVSLSLKSTKKCYFSCSTCKHFQERETKQKQSSLIKCTTRLQVLGLGPHKLIFQYNREYETNIFLNDIFSISQDMKTFTSTIYTKTYSGFLVFPQEGKNI